MAGDDNPTFNPVTGLSRNQFAPLVPVFFGNAGMPRRLKANAITTHQLPKQSGW